MKKILYFRNYFELYKEFIYFAPWDKIKIKLFEKKMAILQQLKKSWNFLKLILF